MMGRIGTERTLFQLFSGLCTTAGVVLNAAAIESNTPSDITRTAALTGWHELLSRKSSDTYDAALAQYRIERAASADTVEGQLVLARWCRRERLHQQERAHYFRVLQLDSEQREARRRLGFRRFNGVWVDSAEMARSLKNAKQAVRDFRKWQPRLNRIRFDWLRNRAERREKLREELLAIREPEAAIAIETVFCSSGGELALLSIDVLEEMPAYQAAAALTRIAVFAPAEEIREAATRALRSHRKHDYVPLMLASMQTPLRAVSEVRGRGMTLTYREVYNRESQYQRQRLVVDTQHHYALRGVSPAMARALPVIAQNDAQRRFARLNALVDYDNSRVSMVNARLCRALATATETRLPWVATAWWEWWNDENEVYVAGEKQLNEAFVSQETTRVVTPPPSGRSGRSDCLAGDTLVWTESGCVPIRQVRVGDLVASCDCESGELAFKPVIRVTRRPPEELLRLEIGTEVLEASGGHPFWVDSAGWEKARNLTKGQPLYSAEGRRTLTAVSAENTQESLNLVVADFHNFFVGKSILLTHDNTVRMPTNMSAPGRTP